MRLKLFKRFLSILGVEYSPNLPKALANAVWLLIDIFIRALVGLILLGWVARYLGPKDFGLLNYVLAIVGIFYYAGTLGLPETLIYFFLKFPHQRQQLLATSLILRLAGQACVLVLSFGTVTFIKPQDHQVQWMVLVIGLGSFACAFDVVDVYFQSEVKSKYTIYAKNTVFLLMSAVRFYLILIKAPLMAFVWAIFFETLFSAIGLLIVYSYKYNKFSIGSFHKTLAWDLLKRCLPMACAGAFWMIQIRLDQILIEHFLGKQKVGIYAAAVRIIEIWLQLGTIIIISSLPAIMKLKIADEKLYYEKLRQLYRLLYRLGLMASCLTSIFAYPIIRIVFGAQYIEAAPVLAVYSLYIVLYYIGSASGYALTAENAQSFNLLRMGLGSLISVILNLILIPKYGIIGSAYAVLFSCFFSFKILPYLLLRKSNLRAAVSI